MQRFRFKNIWLLSYPEHKARHVEFHPSKNLLVGRNHTGKTTLIRSLFETLGAMPQGTLEQWDENAASLLEFSVDDKRYFALHQNRRRALFDATFNLLISTAKFGEWSKRFCEITNFNLVFSDKKQAELVPADPACFFAPFYVNQDGSWQAEWNTFGGMKRFSAPFKAISNISLASVLLNTTQLAQRSPNMPRRSRSIVGNTNYLSAPSSASASLSL